MGLDPKCPRCESENILVPWEKEFTWAATRVLLSCTCKDCGQQILLEYRFIRVLYPGQE